MYTKRPRDIRCTRIQTSTKLFCYTPSEFNGSTSTLINIQSSITCVYESTTKIIVWEQEHSEQQIQEWQSYELH